MLSFQNIIFTLQKYWAKQGCCILQPYDLEMGAGTFHSATVLKCLGPKPWRVAYVQPSRRPTDSRYAQHPNRLQYYYQFQVIIKPSIDNIQELYLDSLKAIGIDPLKQDIRFVEDDWASPTLGASGLGWEIWCNGMEVTQFTYMQQIGSIPCDLVSVEITYGLERLALYIQNKNSVYDLIWNEKTPYEKEITYGDITSSFEKQFSYYNLEYANTELLLKDFINAESESKRMVELNLPYVAYEFCIKASHIFNLLDARNKISTTERENYISRIRAITKATCSNWIQINKE